MANGVVYTGFDPEFGDRLNRLMALAKGEGYVPTLISGTRSAYGWPGMKGQSQADLYNQLGKPGGPRAAAPPGYSPHQYGVASDVTGIPQSELARLATQVGLRTISGDPNHVELANWQQEAAAQPPRTAWDQTNPANVPSAYASNVDAPIAPASAAINAASPPGTSLNSNPFVNSLVQIESGNKNIYSGVDKDYPGQPNSRSQGYVQADVPTWRQFAPTAGVDISQYPTPMSAPRDVQMQGISNIPLSRFGSRTQSMLAQQYGQLDTSKTIGQLAALAPGSAAPSPPIPGQTGVVDPSIAAHASTTPPIAPPMTAGDWIKKATTPGEGGKASPLSAGMATLAKAVGGGDDQLQQGQQQAQQGEAQRLQAEQSAAAYGAQRQQSLAANARQLMGQVLAAGRKPLSWGSAPPGGGVMPGAGAGQLPSMPQSQDDVLVQLMQQGGSMGTGLNSMGDYNG